MTRATTPWARLGWGLVIVVALAASLVALRPGERRSALASIGDPTVWLASVARGQVVQVNAASGDVTGRAGVAADDGFTVHQLGNHALVRTGDGGVRRLDAASQQLGDDEVAQAVTDVAVAGTTAALLGERSLSWVSEDARAVPQPATLSRPARSVAVATSGRTWVLGPHDEVIAVGDDGNETPTGVTATRLIEAGGQVFASDGDDIVGLSVDDRATCAGFADATLVSGGAPGDGSRLVAAVVVDETAELHWVDPAAGDCASVTIGDADAVLGEPVVAQGAIFVPNERTGAVVVVDLGSPIGAPPLPR